jgi:urease accessory protein
MTISSSPWHGQLQLDFDYRQGETIVSRSQSQAPLKFQRPFYPEGKLVCHGVLLHTAGGVVGGDRLSTQICLNPSAQALLTTAAATKIYGSTMESNQTIHIQVAESACLEWLPQETILFDGARYHQTLRVELAPLATWMGWEITRLGRSAKGEQFLSGEWRSHTEVWQAGRLLWVDPQWLLGGNEMIQSPHGLAGYPVVGSFAFVGQDVSKEWVEAVRSRWASASDLPGEIGVTRLMNGLLCRYRGNSTAAARLRFIEAWDVLRGQFLGRSSCVPRVW